VGDHGTTDPTLFGREGITCAQNVQVVGGDEYSKRFAGSAILRNNNVSGRCSAGVRCRNRGKLVWNLKRNCSHQTFWRSCRSCSSANTA